jgi:predicted ATPase
MGKTRLAIEFARRHQDLYSGGAYFVPLAPLASPEHMVSAVATAVGLQLKPDREASEQLLRFFGSRRALLVMDNFEHLVEGAGLVTDILGVAPEMCVLATSRERLKLSAECLYEVTGMATPEEDEAVSMGEFDALQMFVTYAQRVQPDYELGEADRPAVAGLCRLVDGSPLAIELAAVWVRTLSPAEILEELATDFDLLETSTIDMPRRLRSLRASFDYSLRLLRSDERDALMKLSIFRGGFDRDAARDVTGATIRTLAGMVDKAMIHRDPVSGRYHIHELIRQFAEELLIESDQPNAAYDRHADYYSSIAKESMNQASRDGDWDAYYERIEPELDNIRTAIKRSLSNGDTETALQLSSSISDYLVDHGFRREAARWLEQSFPSDEDSVSPAVLADAYLTLASQQMVRGERILAAKKGLEIYRQIDDKFGIARGLMTYGFSHFGYDYDRSRDLISQAIEARDELGLDTFSALQTLSTLERIHGDLEAAHLANEKCRVIADKTGSKDRLMNVRRQQASIYYYQDRFEEAQQLAEEVQVYFDQDRGEYNRFVALGVLLDIALDSDDLKRSHWLIQERMKLVKKTDFLYLAMFFFHQIARWFFLRGQLRQAAFWIGCHDYSREYHNQPLEPVKQPRYKRLIATVQEELGREAYEMMWQEGHAMDLEEAVDYGLRIIKED